MLLHNKLIECFPTKSKEKVEIEIGVIQDLSRTVILERYEGTFDISQLITS
jgi:hypothetical protein